MLFWSLPFWFYFEASNLVLQNWYYVFGFRTWWAGAAMAVLAYATVLPACLFHEELLEAWGLWKEKACRPIPIRPGLLTLVGAGGIVCALVPLLLPRIAFPAIWFGPIGLDAVNYRRGSPSLLKDLEQGRRGRLLRLLAGGLWAGIVWESVNFVARCKWIYTVSGLRALEALRDALRGVLRVPNSHGRGVLFLLVRPKSSGQSRGAGRGAPGHRLLRHRRAADRAGDGSVAETSSRRASGSGPRGCRSASKRRNPVAGTAFEDRVQARRERTRRRDGDSGAGALARRGGGGPGDSQGAWGASRCAAPGGRRRQRRRARAPGA